MNPNGIKVACDSRGNYRKELGWKRSGDGYRQHCFYLGTDRAAALIRSLELGRVWDGVQKRWQRDRLTERPLWDADTLAIASAVAKGERAVRLNHTAGVEGKAVPAEVVAAWLTQLRHDFPFVQLDLLDTVIQVEGQARLEKAAEGHAATLAFIRQGTTGQTLWQALDGFADWIRGHYIGTDGKLTATGGVRLAQVKSLKEHHPDCPLAALNLPALEMMVHHWRTRPAKKNGGLMSVNHCRDMVKRVQQFIKWLHKNPAFNWRKPQDYEPQRSRIPLTHEELAAKMTASQVQTYTPEQLVTLYDYATPLERTFLLLALNCGFGAAEVGSLQLAEVILDKPHGHYPIHGSFVKRLRFKSSVYGEWTLWPETVQAVRWTLARRPKTIATTLLVTSRGEPYAGTTEAGNRSQRVQNMWRMLRARIVKDFPDFPDLSYNKLRKTGADMIRRASDGETAGVFLSHGNATRTDALADVYTNRDFPKVFAAIAKVRETLAPMFAAVPNPFPADYRKRNPSTSLGTIRRIQAMAGEGKTQKEIAEALGLSDETVRRYLKPE